VGTAKADSVKAGAAKADSASVGAVQADSLSTGAAAIPPAAASVAGSTGEGGGDLVPPGTWEFQGGFSGIVLPEAFNGTWSAQIEGRAGYFIKEALEIQGMINWRVWPLGGKAPHYYDFGVSALWFPKIGDIRNMYLLGGAGGAVTDPPHEPEGGFKPLIRAGVGFKVPMRGLEFLGNAYLTMEYRAEMVFIDDPEFFEDPTIEDGSDFVSGAAIGISYFK
jgi:hypothetical protein